jgi:DNA (cytosine-5)-methyltransferase 1
MRTLKQNIAVQSVGMNGKVISIFSGCGGSSLGYKWAGFKELLAIDNNKNSVETFKLNFPEIPVWCKDIKEITGEEILDFCKIKKGEIDILDGSPPCQGFSMAGKGDVNDKRNDLFDEFIRLIKEIEPKVFLIENVSGQIKGKMKGKFKEIVKKLKELDYNIKIKLMNTKYYGVPQSRERIIYLGIRNDLNKEPLFPEPSMKLISVKEALKNVNNKTFHNVKLREKQIEDRVLWGAPSSTLIKQVNSIRSSCVVHPKENRHLTIEEAKRLCSFPDNFILTGSFSEQWARLGNAVMPKFMEAIAIKIKETLYGKI